MSVTDHINPAAGNGGYSLRLDVLQRGVLWLLISSSWLVFIEPSPYEFMFLLTLLIYLAQGMTVTGAMMPFVVFLLLYNVGGALSVIPVSGSPKAITFVVTSFYMAVMAMFFAFVCAKAPMKTMAVIRNAYVLAATVAALCGILGYFDVAGTGAIFAPEARAQATFKDGNVYSTYLLLPTVMLIHGLATGTQSYKLLSTCALLLLLAAIFLAFSRGGWVVLILSTGLCLGLTFIVASSAALRSRIILYTIAGGITVACLLVFALSIEEVRALFIERAKLIQSYDSGETGRFGTQLNSIPHLMQSPNGLGPMQFGKLMGQDPHNVYLNAFSSYGWLGGFSYLLLIAATVSAGWRSVFTRTPWQPYSIVVFSVLFASMLQGLQIDTDHWRHFYLQLGLMWGLYAATEMYRRSQT